MSKRVQILLPVHNRRQVTSRFIDCLKVQTHDNYNLILIDDGSTDGTAEMVQSQISSLTVIRGKGEWWWAGCLQQGYLWLKRQRVPADDIILIINDDTQFRDNFLETAVRILSEKSRTLLLARNVSLQDGRLIDSGVHVDWKTLSHQQAATPDQINCLSTRGLFFRMADFMEIGGFYPRLLPHYASDFEFTIRAHRKGFAMATDSTLQLIGDEQTTGIHRITEESLMILIRKLFSIKFILNPVVWTSYIALACPWRWKIINIWRIWRNVFLLLAATAKRDIKRRLFVGHVL